MTMLIGVIAFTLVLVVLVLLLVMWAVIRLSREALDAVAQACSVDSDSLRARVDSGETLQEVAAEYGVDAERVSAETVRYSNHRWVAWISRRTNWDRVLR